MFTYCLRRVLLLAAVLSLSACAGDPTPPASAMLTDDVSITSNVEAAVIAVPGVHSPATQVQTTDGVVNLRGTAANQVAARNAVQAARQVPGVKRVEFDIRVPSAQ